MDLLLYTKQGMPDTICGYALADVRRSLRDAIDRRDRRPAQRWTAELVATPGAVGSLWASYWIAWATAQGAGSASPTVPILLKQTWDTMTEAATAMRGDWTAFRNHPEIRAITAETTERLIGQSRQTPVVWPTKEITLYDVSTMRDSPAPAAVDARPVLRVWQRDEDAMELRMMAGRWLHAIQQGDLRTALSAVTWTLMPQAQQGLAMPLKCETRGPAELTPKQRSSPLWFWLAVGKAVLTERTQEPSQPLHRGWLTMHNAVTSAFRLHYKRWTAVERLRVLLAWILQIRASYLPQPATLWSSPAIALRTTEIDLPYKEVAAELADPSVAVIQYEKAPVPKQIAKDEKKAASARAEAKLAEADAKIMAMMGLANDDM